VWCAQKRLCLRKEMRERVVIEYFMRSSRPHLRFFAMWFRLVMLLAPPPPPPRRHRLPSFPSMSCFPPSPMHLYPPSFILILAPF